jgi:hypothetical protein
MANANLSELHQFYTGAGSNSDPSLSLGGNQSSVRVLSQTVSGFTTLTGVVADDAIGNSIGDGTISFTASSTTITWLPSGGAQGTTVDIGTDGSYFVQGAGNGGGLLLTVVAASLPTSNVSNTLTIANQTEKHFLDQTKNESDTGVTKYHCFSFKNTSAEPIKDVTLYISENTPGSDGISLALDPLAAATGITGPTSIVETVGPGLTFVAPDSRTHADALDMGDLLPSESRYYWVQQITPPGIVTATTANTHKIGVYMRG